LGLKFGLVVNVQGRNDGSLMGCTCEIRCVSFMDSSDSAALMQ
jgi:hypothetical protein